MASGAAGGELVPAESKSLLHNNCIRLYPGGLNVSTASTAFSAPPVVSRPDATNGSDVRLVDGVFTNNVASGSGGVFYAGEGVSVEMSQALVERNEGGDGGVVSISSSVMPFSLPFFSVLTSSSMRCDPTREDNRGLSSRMRLTCLGMMASWCLRYASRERPCGSGKLWNRETPDRVGLLVMCASSARCAVCRCP